MPILDITWLRVAEDIQVTTDPYYNIKIVDWAWFRKWFTDCDLSCLVLLPNELKRAGITGHWGFYSLADGDMNHQFYMTNLRVLHHKARANGFKSNCAWMFVHEYLHGARWEETKDRQKAAQDVHDWEDRGELIAQLNRYLAQYKELETKVSLLGSLYEKLKALVATKPATPVTTTPTKLVPLVERQAVKIIESMEKLGQPIRIVEGFRSIERQNQLYAQGRTTAGNIVTNAKGGESFHNYGVAVDFVFRKEGYNATQAQWQTLGNVGKSHGFEWGGSPEWIKAGLNDRPHFEMKLGYTLKDFQQGKVDYSKFL
jgi:peptidoglycan L-alanyl-D-glutamate endopeptidase CwlK